MRYASLLLVLALTAGAPASAGPWRRAYVVDARLSALRAGPDLAAPILKRLRVGRAIAVLERRRGRDGLEWTRVAVTRRTRGWLLVEAVAWPGDAPGERRLAARIDEERGLERIEAARLAADRFPPLRRSATEALEHEATIAAAKLSRAVARRLGPLDGVPLERVRVLMLSDPALDRYNRLGITFDADPVRRLFRPGQFRLQRPSHR